MMDFGFGFMRLPQLDKNDESSVDIVRVKEMVDRYMESDFNYFDLGFEYHVGISEVAFKEAVVDRYSREDYIVSDKLPIYLMPKSEDEFKEFFNTQIERTGLEYFDYYMVHNASGWTDNAFRNLDVFKFMRDLKNDGKIKHIGISSHDDAKFLDELFSEYPEIEFALLQVNYLDWDNDGFQARKCCEVCNKHGVDIFVMEPLRGGILVNLSEDIAKIFTDYDADVSLASWALRFARSVKGVKSVLSGMSSIDQLEDNLKYMEDFKPLSDEEYEVINKAKDLINADIEIPCTYCNYCLKHCPINMPISRYFELVNAEKRGNGIPGFSIPTQMYINMTKSGGYPKASDCEECGACSAICPQQLDISKYLKEIVVPTIEKDAPL